MFRVRRRRYASARRIACRLGVSAQVFLCPYEQPLWRVPRPRVIRDRARWDMVEVEYWLAINGHRVAPSTVGWSLLELLRPRCWHPPLPGGAQAP